MCAARGRIGDVDRAHLPADDHPAEMVEQAHIGHHADQAMLMKAGSLCATPTGHHRKSGQMVRRIEVHHRGFGQMVRRTWYAERAHHRESGPMKGRCRQPCADGPYCARRRGQLRPTGSIPHGRPFQPSCEALWARFFEAHQAAFFRSASLAFRFFVAS